MHTEYPVGHAKVKVFSSDQTTVNWTHSSQNPYRGLLKVLVEPPRRTLIPVLPKRFPNDDRLLFALCPLCAETYRNRRPSVGLLCRHSPDERCFVVTLPHIEINEALDNGYTIREIYRVWQFNEYDCTLFSDYVRDFLRLKIQATGFPKSLETDEQRRQYLLDIYKHEGIWIEPEDIHKNEGLR